MKDWQKGIELERLKEIARPFKECLGPHTHGAFGLPKERDVAEAMAGDRLLVHGSPADETAIVAILKAPGRHRDFTGRVVKIPTGCCYVSAWGWLSAENYDSARPPGNLWPTIQDYAGDADIWWELHEENEPAKALADVLGFEWVTTKVSAGSDITGLYRRPGKVNRGLLGDLQKFGWDEPAEYPGVARLVEDFIDKDERRELLAEIASLDKWWADHYSGYNKRHSWQAIALKGYGKDPGFIIKPAEMSRKWKADNIEMMGAEPVLTAAAEHAPKLMALCDRLPGGERDRVRLMRLAPNGGELSRHADITDREAGVSDKHVARLHLPLKSNKEVVFQSWNARGQMRKLRMKPRSLYYLDQRKPHACCNGGEDERIHFVVDTYGTPELRQLIAEPS